MSAGLGSDVAGALLAKADSEDAKCRLKAITDEALKRCVKRMGKNRNKKKNKLRRSIHHTQA